MLILAEWPFLLCHQALTNAFIATVFSRTLIQWIFNKSGNLESILDMYINIYLWPK